MSVVNDFQQLFILLYVKRNYKGGVFMGRKIPMWQCVLVILAMVVLLMWGVLKDDGGEGHIALVLAGGFAGIIAMLNGWKWSYLEAGILASINRSMQAMLILMVVGMMLGTWAAGGVIASMMYFGIKVIAPSIFLFTACLLCAIVSLATGSSWSTAGSMGVALIGVGTALGFSPALTAGAVVSGAYFGDKMSPLSDTTNLAPAMAGSNLFDHIKHMIFTTGPAFVISLVLYLVIGFTKGTSATADTETVTKILGMITDNFNVGLIYLIPPVFVILAVILKLPALPALLIGALLGIPFMLMQGQPVTNIFNAMNNGFALPDEYLDSIANDDVLAELGGLLEGKGAQGMLWTVSLIIFAMCFGGIVDCTGIMASLAGVLLKLAKGRGGLVLATELSCLIVNIICCDQYLSLVLPGRMFKESFEDMRLKPKNLSRCLEDCGTITSNFVPWNTCGATMHSFLGVGQWGAGGYAPFAFLCYLNPLISIFYGFTGITMEKMSEDEYKEILRQREEEKAAALRAAEA